MTRTKLTHRKSTRSKRPIKQLPIKAAATKEGKKPRRYRPGTVSLREIRHHQKSGELLLRKAPFSRLVRQVSKKFWSDFRYGKAPILAAQESSEAYLTKLSNDALHCMLHTTRRTVMPDDIKLVRKIRKESDKPDT